MMDPKVARLLLTAGGAVLCIYLTTKFHKNIFQKLKLLKNSLFSKVFVKKANFNMRIIDDEISCKEVIAALKTDCETWPVCGFDCEWVTRGHRRPVAMIQLCSANGLCALIRVCNFPENLPEELKNFLEDPDILKVGVTPLNDAHLLLQDYAINTKSTLDLRFLALLTQPTYTGGLAKLSKAILNIDLDKDWKLVCSDWEADVLTEKQTNYAAYDAFVAVEIFRKLYSSIQSNGDDEPMKSFCESYLDRQFKAKFVNGITVITRQVEQKTISKVLKRSYATRSTPLYHNCHLQAPDGELLCTIDRKKAEWYVRNNLGVEINNEIDSSYIVRLNFEPSGRARGEVGEYYRSVKENKCVVCGRTQDLVRKNVVPHEYRKFFPLVMKAKTSHDVVLLCLPCHQQSNIKDLRMRRKLEIEFNAPMKETMQPEVLETNKTLRHDQRVARALLKETNIPEWRKQELKEILSKSYPNQELTEDFLETIITKEQQLKSDDSLSHAKIVVESFIKEERLIELERLWREHFLIGMEPKFLPELWDVNHNGNRLEIRASEGRVTAEELKVAGVNAVVIPKAPAIAIVQADSNVQDIEVQFDSTDQDNIDSSTNSEWEYGSAISSRHSRSGVDPDRTLTTDDDRYFSDVTSMQSYYETVRSDGSTIDDFQSFTSSLTERPDFDSDISQRSSISLDTDTEVEDHLENDLKK